MKKNLWNARMERWFALAIGVILLPAGAWGIEKKVVLDSQTEVTADENKQSETTPGHGVSIRWIEVDKAEEEARLKNTAWFGVSTSEAAEDVAAQLRLKTGSGLQIIYVAPNSPAAKAGFQKHDVLVNFDDQLLVHPSQLRKLVQTHKQGDAIKIEYYRAGEKEIATATLGQIPDKYAGLDDDKVFRGRLDQLTRELTERKTSAEYQHKALHDAFMAVKMDRDKLQAELHRGMDQVRKTIQEATLSITNVDLALEPVRRALREIAGSGVVLESNATVTIRSAGKDVSSIVTADDSGTIVILSNPKPHLTAHYKDGHLIFDGQIQTTEERAKVPKELWIKVEPLLSRMGEEQK
jgi:membrane-associated protease RseP (regulator of RpoE activity)